MSKLQITVKDGKTRIVMNGADITGNCLSYCLTHGIYGNPVMELELLPDELEVECDEIAVDVLDRLPCIPSQPANDHRVQEGTA